MKAKITLEDLVGGHVREAEMRDGVPTFVVETTDGRQLLVEVILDHKGTGSGRLHVSEPATGQFLIVGDPAAPRATTDPRERGRRGGLARAKKLTAERLSEIGRLGAVVTNTLLKRRVKGRARQPVSLVRRRPRKSTARDSGPGTPQGSSSPSR